MLANPESPPLVSVIIPTYNRTKYLQQALHSAVAQTYENIEIIVTDNASDPKAFTEIRKIVESFCDPRIRLHKNSENLGIMRNNVNAFRACRGKYFANLHDDDAWTPHFLEKLVAALESDDQLSVAFCDHFIMDEWGNRDMGFTQYTTRRWHRAELTEGKYQPFFELALVFQAIPAAMGSVFRKSALDLEDFPEGTGFAYDLWLAYLACREGQGAYYFPERLTSYRIHESSATALGILSLHEGLAYCFDAFSEDPRLDRYAKVLRFRSSEYHAMVASQLLLVSERDRARKHGKIGIKRSLNGQSAAGYILGMLPLLVSQRILKFRKAFMSNHKPKIERTPEFQRKQQEQPVSKKVVNGDSRISYLNGHGVGSVLNIDEEYNS